MHFKAFGYLAWFVQYRSSNSCSLANFAQYILKAYDFYPFKPLQHKWPKDPKKKKLRFDLKKK